ncbi:glycosyltransferase family 9 protein [Lysobacter sp. D1-1-M9]|uniref:glycosyltransferase family 9 protein n=2 Tax=Novilysobacter TaxID=3382699 RepID=UPI002FCC28DD
MSRTSSLRLARLRRRIAQSAMRLVFGSTSKPSRGAPLPSAGIHRILVCHISHTLGNALLLTPLIQELQAVYPGARIDIVTRSPVAEAIYGRYFNVGCIFKLPGHGFGRPWRYLREWRRLRREHYDLVVDPDPQSQTGRLLTMMAKGRRTLGFDSPKKSGNVTHSVAIADAPRSVGQRSVFLLRAALGQVPERASYPVPDIRLDAREREQGREALARLLASHGLSPAPHGVIGVFANATGGKLLPSDWWAQFLQTLEPLSEGYHIVEIVPAFGRSLLGSRYPAYFSSDLRKLASVLSALSVYASADCGVMHLACASRVPTYGIFTATDADEWGSYGPGNHVIRAYDMAPAEVARELIRIANGDVAPARAAAVIARAVLPAG